MNTEFFGNIVKAALEEKLKDITANVRKEALNKLDADISKLMATIAFEIFEVCRVDMAGQELRISVDTSKIKALRGE
jgi:hypothetical protein